MRTAELIMLVISRVPSTQLVVSDVTEHLDPENVKWIDEGFQYLIDNGIVSVDDKNHSEPLFSYYPNRQNKEEDNLSGQ